MNVQIVPNKTEMRAYLKRGLTQQQIVDEWEKDSGARVSRSAIAMAISRYGLRSSNPRPRYMDTIPWKVAHKHRMHADLRLLRLEARRRRGEDLSQRDLTWLNGWRRELEEKQAVIVYRAETDEGFWWVPREETDVDIVRRPAE